MDKKKKDSIAIISIKTDWARQIFDGIRIYDFRKNLLMSYLLNKKIYVYSNGEEEAIVGYVRVKRILYGNIHQVLKATRFKTEEERLDVINYYGAYNNQCFVLELYDVTEFSKYLTLEDIRKFDKDFERPQSIRYVSEDDSLYKIIKEWDDVFSLNGSSKSHKNDKQVKKKILSK